MKNPEEKTEYWSRRALSYMDSMRLARKAGLFPKKEGWRNVVEHELVESEIVDVLCEACKVPDEIRNIAVKAALLHDLGKRFQRKKIDEGLDQSDKTKISLLEEASKFQDTLIRDSFPEAAEKIISLTNSVGHISLIDLVQDPNAEQLELKDDLDLSVLIIHYADDITCNNQICDIDSRIDALEKKDPPYPEAEKGRDFFNGKTYYQVQRIVGHLIEAKLAGIIGVESLTKFIKDKINKRIQEQS